MIRLMTPHFQAALAALSQSDMAAPLPRRLAATFADLYHLRLFDPPYPSPPFDIMALWHRDHGEETQSLAENLEGRKTPLIAKKRRATVAPEDAKRERETADLPKRRIGAAPKTKIRKKLPGRITAPVP